MTLSVIHISICSPLIVRTYYKYDPLVMELITVIPSHGTVKAGNPGHDYYYKFTNE